MLTMDREVKESILKAAAQRNPNVELFYTQDMNGDQIGRSMENMETERTAGGSFRLKTQSYFR